MAGFIGDFSFPRSQTVDPRRSILLTWLYYFVEGDIPVQYFLISWKPAATKGWGSAKTHKVNFPDNVYHIPPYTLQENQFYSWKVEAFSQDESTGVVVSAGSHLNMFEANGFTLVNENIFGTTNSAYIDWSGSIDPGEYEVRVRARNTFQWSAYSAVQTIKVYDTRKFARRSGRWWAVPVWKKTSGTMKITK